MKDAFLTAKHINKNKFQLLMNFNGVNTSWFKWGEEKIVREILIKNEQNLLAEEVKLEFKFNLFDANELPPQMYVGNEFELNRYCVEYMNIS